MERRDFLKLTALTAALPGVAVHAQQSASRILVGASPGGGTDFLARMVGQEIGKLLDMPVLVENRPGAGGNIAALAVAKSPPDGKTFLLSYTSHAINASLYPSLPFDPVNDFTPISGIATAPALLVARPSIQVDDFKQLLAFAKSNPGKLTIAIPGLGSSSHMAGELLKYSAGIDIRNVPYKGTAPALQDVMSGEVDLVFAGISTTPALIKAGKIKALAITSPQRLSAFPDAAAIAEELPGYDSNAWYGLFGPAQMPTDIADQWAHAAATVLESNEIRDRLATFGMMPMSVRRADFGRFVSEEIERWRKVVAATGAKGS